MIPRIIFNCFITSGLMLVVACHQPEENQTAQPTALPATVAKTVLPAPFRYHRLIESSPANYFDIFSWGRGKDSSGAYLILHSDSVGKIYSTISGDLEGAIIDVYNTDMNMDGNPEILIEARTKDTINQINIYAYEFTGNKSRKLDFPKLSAASKKGYRGGDNFYIKEGNLIREFGIFDGTGKKAKPTGKKKILQYGLNLAGFTVKDISPQEDKDKSKTPPVVAAKPVVHAIPKKTKAAHHVAPKKKKHKHRH